MFKFHILRVSKELLGHLILVFLPILLISFFYYVNSSAILTSGAAINTTEVSTVLTIGFALTFQIYGSAISFETFGHDFLSPIHDRLLAAPVSPRKIVFSVLFTGIVVSFLQTIVIVIFNQLFGTVILFLTKKVKTATAITSLYGVLAPIIMQLYFPLPDTKIFNLLEKYLTPISLAKTATFGILNQNYRDLLAGLIPLMILIVILFILIKPLSRKVIV